VIIDNVSIKLDVKFCTFYQQTISWLFMVTLTHVIITVMAKFLSFSPYCHLSIINRLGLQTLELRRLQLDLMFCYKIVFGLTSLTSSDYFQFSRNTNTRGHAYKLYISQNSCNIRRKFLPCRILTVWNSLPANTDFSSLAAIRRTVFSIDFAKFLHCNND